MKQSAKQMEEDKRKHQARMTELQDQKTGAEEDLLFAEASAREANDVLDALIDEIADLEEIQGKMDSRLDKAERQLKQKQSAQASTEAQFQAVQGKRVASSP